MVVSSILQSARNIYGTTGLFSTKFGMTGPTEISLASFCLGHISKPYTALYMNVKSKFGYLIRNN
jgi:hypothetical protein